MTAFNEASETILGMKAEDLKLKLAGGIGGEKLENLLSKLYYLNLLELTVRVRKENFGGEPGTNVACTDAKVVNVKQHGRALLNDIRHLLATR